MPRLLPIGLSILVAILIAVLANAYFMRPSAALLHPLDEAYAAAFARRMLEGDFLPYVDAVSHRGPVFYALTALGVKVFGTGTWMAVRALALGTTVLTVLAGGWASARAGRPLAGAVMALVYSGALCIVLPIDDGLAFNSEQPLSMFAMVSLGCLVLALDPKSRRRVAWAVLSGVALSASGLSKQTGFILLLPFGAWLLCAAASAPELTLRERRRVPVAFALGVLGPLVLLVARYAAAGELGALHYYLVTYNARVYLPAFLSYPPLRDAASTSAIGTHLHAIVVLAPLVLWAIVSSFRGVRTLRDVPRAFAENGFELTVALATLLSAFAANSALRNYPHYYVQVVPWAGLLVGVVIERGAGRLRATRPLWGVQTVVLAPLAIVMAFALERRLEGFEVDGTTRARFSTPASPVCRFLQEHTEPHESLFIWGFWPAPYTTCNRRPASRYVYTTFVAGYVPQVNDDPANDRARVVPGSLRILRDELTRDPPAAILDFPLTLGLRPLETNEFLRQLVKEHYCEVKADVGQVGARAWIRRGRAGCSAR